MIGKIIRYPHEMMSHLCHFKIEAKSKAQNKTILDIYQTAGVLFMTILTLIHTIMHHMNKNIKQN